MLTIYVPEQYTADQRALRAAMTFGLLVKAGVPKGKVVWAVADATAEQLGAVDYREYDWSQVDSLCFGADDEILIETDKIKPEHDVVTIPQLAWSLYMDQAIPVILAHYVTYFPDGERDDRVKEMIVKKLKAKAIREQKEAEDARDESLERQRLGVV